MVEETPCINPHITHTKQNVNKVQTDSLLCCTAVFYSHLVHRHYNIHMLYTVITIFTCCTPSLQYSLVVHRHYNIPILFAPSGDKTESGFGTATVRYFRNIRYLYPCRLTTRTCLLGGPGSLHHGVSSAQSRSMGGLPLAPMFPLT